MEDRQATLRAMRICRFCLTEKDPLSNIYERDNKNAIPLPLQIMACVTIEVFSNDGMPQLICDDCRLQTRKSYSFKTMCKKSDDALKLYLATGVLTKHEKEEILKPIAVKKRSNDTEIQASAQKRSKPNNNATNNETGQIESTVATEIINTTLVTEDDKFEDQEEYQEPFISEEEGIEQGEIPKSELDQSSLKQVITHCFSCNHCERSFPLQQLLDIHMRQHTRERKFSCEECNKKFFSKHDLNKHAQIHSGEKPYKCVVCSKSFNRTNILQRHEKTHVTVPKYLCTFCDKTYLSSAKLEAHMSVHKKKRPYKCEHCDKCFAFKQGLERHTPIHNPENPYKCDYCEESFTTAGKLARHVTSHAGSRPFPCKYCPRTFLLSHHLTRHLRNHYNRKALEVEYGDFKCDFCSMSFRRKDSLINHTAIHSMVNLKCVICNKEFNDAQTVKEHVSTHLSGLPYPCDKCDYSFETQEELEDHEVKHVDDDEEEEEDDEYILENTSLQVVQATQDEADEDDEPPKVRRSQRESKIKNYADFLKDELGSDSEEEIEESEEEKPEVPIGTIQPVIRSDTIKMYKGVKVKGDKNVDQKLILTPIESPKIVNDAPLPEMPKLEPAPKSVTKITTLENLGITKQTLDAMTDKSGFVEMKLGQKVIRVQKLMMSKSEYQAMSKKTKLEMKGSTVVLQNIEGGLDLKKLTLLKGVISDPISDSFSKISESKVAIDPNVDVQLPKTPVRTYVKKTIIKKEDLSQENQYTEEVKKQMSTESNNIDLTNVASNSTTVQETDILETFDI